MNLEDAVNHGEHGEHGVKAARYEMVLGKLRGDANILRIGAIFSLFSVVQLRFLG